MATAASLRTACPRCARASGTWTFERDQGLAGCPCGEVISVAFDEAPLAAISKTARKPCMWLEDARTDGFVATLRPSTRHVWYVLLVMLVFTVPRGVLFGGVLGAVYCLLLVAATIGWLVWQSAGPWTFAIENGRFRASARSHSTDVALEDIQRFDVRRRPKFPKLRMGEIAATFELVVSRTNGERVRIPLFVQNAEEAQFIAERANTMLASDGRTIAGDYRGHVRIAEVESERENESELEVDVDVEERSLLRRR